MNRTAYLIFFISLSYSVYAQTDTIYIAKTDTVFASIEHDRMYRFFVQNRGTETNHLWKLNLVDVCVMRLNVGYENKLGKKWSVEGYLSYGVRDIYELGQRFYPSLEAEQLFKFYYNLNRRERLGKKTYGFSGNYFATSLWYEYYTTPGSVKDPPDYNQSVYNYNMGIKYGLQRRIGNFGYIDLFAGIYYRYQFVQYDIINFQVTDELPDEYKHTIVPVLGLKVGFAIDSFDNLRRMLKD
jgi:hypothetical protein